MRTALTLVCAFLLSLLVGGIVQNQLAVWFRADVEFIMAVLIFIVLAQITSLALGIALVRRANIGRVALWLIGIVLALTIAALLWSAIAQGSFATMRPDALVLLYIALPTVIMIAIQWWFIHRRALRIARENVAG